MTESELRSKRAGVKALAPTFISRCELSSALRQPHGPRGKTIHRVLPVGLRSLALGHALNCRCTGHLTSRLTSGRNSDAYRATGILVATNSTSFAKRLEWTGATDRLLLTRRSPAFKRPSRGGLGILCFHDACYQTTSRSSLALSSIR